MVKPFEEIVKRSVSKAAQARAAKLTQKYLDEMLLSELRTASGKTQKEVAKVIGIKQPSLSKLEKQTDMQLSTLTKIVNALGGELEIVAKFPKGLVTLGQFMPRKRPKART